LGRLGMAEPIAEALRQLVTTRAHGRCEYCQSPEAYATERFSVEHIQPRTLHGPTVTANLALACQGCNGYKSAKITSVDPETGEMVELFHPRQHVWWEHFTWSEDGLRIVGLTPTGRATVALLRINRPPLMNLRRALTAIDAHPSQG
jgi:5-methylcytosine-specific restriction endonuclease McrA